MNVCGTWAIGFYTLLASCPKPYSCHFRLPEASQMFVCLGCCPACKSRLSSSGACPIVSPGEQEWVGRSQPGSSEQGKVQWSGAEVPPQAILDVRGIVPSEAGTASVPGSLCRQPALEKFPCSSAPHPMWMQNCCHLMWEEPRARGVW